MASNADRALGRKNVTNAMSSRTGDFKSTNFKDNESWCTEGDANGCDWRHDARESIRRACGSEFVSEIKQRSIRELDQEMEKKQLNRLMNGFVGIKTFHEPPPRYLIRQPINSELFPPILVYLPHHSSRICRGFSES